MSNESIYNFEVKTIEGKKISLSDFKGKILLIVNTASKCGYTQQYEGLENLYQKYKQNNFIVLAFPCNQFARQEPGTESEIENFCRSHYQVSFPLFAKIEVNGLKAHPLYKYLKKQKKGLLGTEFIKWNFTKFLVNQVGEVVDRFAPQVKPDEIETHIRLLV